MGLLNGITLPGTAVGVILAVCILAVVAVLRRYNTGFGEVTDGYGELNDRFSTDAVAARADAALARAETAKAAFELSVAVGQLGVAREYARHLEDRLGIPHRDWTVTG